MAGDFIDSLGGKAPDGGSSTTGTVADQLRNQVLSAILKALQSKWPDATASISATATAGAATLPANPAAFLTITVGALSYKVPLYNL